MNVCIVSEGAITFEFVCMPFHVLHHIRVYRFSFDESNEFECEIHKVPECRNVSKQNENQTAENQQENVKISKTNFIRIQINEQQTKSIEKYVSAGER